MTHHSLHVTQHRANSCKVTWTKTFLIVVENHRLWPREEMSHLQRVFFTFVKFRKSCGFIYHRGNFLLINCTHNFHTANLKRKHVEVKRRKWTGAFSEISATRPWIWKRKAFHITLTEVFEIKQSKWSQNSKDSRNPGEENWLLDESIHCFLFGSLFHTDNFAQEQNETVNFIAQRLRDSKNYNIPFQSKICFLSHGKFLIW